MEKNFIRLNVNDNYLSLGNLFRVIKEESGNNNIMQPDLFSIIFNTDDFADSTVNNYCTGLRSINSKYKNYIKQIKDEFDMNENVLINTVVRLLELIEDRIIDDELIKIEDINNSTKLKQICNRLYSISKNDSEVSNKISNVLYKNLEEENLYKFIVEILFYVILERKQPIYVEKNLNDVIEKNIYDTNISINDIQDFIKIQLNSGIWSIRGIQELAKKNNPFACFELASMECYGIISGKPRYEKAYEYYKIAADYNHPVASWAIGYLYYSGHIGSKSKTDLYLAFKYFNKARKLKCSNAFNSLGLIILNGNVPHIKPNKQKAIEMFENSISMGNIYAYNNLGKIYEEEKNYQKAYYYYMFAADSGESWAANKVAEYYRKGIGRKKDLKKAFEYYNIAIESAEFTMCKWAKYNLAIHFYKEGKLEIGIEKNINKTIELLNDISDEIIEASEELIYIYYDLYLKSNKKEKCYFDKLNYNKTKCENSINYNKKIKNRIEKQLLDIKNTTGEICIPD